MPNNHNPTEETRQNVQQMAAIGTPQEDICIVLGVSGKTLRKHYREELDKARIKATANIGGSLYKQAMAGNVTAAIFWMKTQAGWKEGDGGGANININIGGNDAGVL